jgi:hypothetical protein
MEDKKEADILWTAIFSRKETFKIWEDYLQSLTVEQVNKVFEISTLLENSGKWMLLTLENNCWPHQLGLKNKKQKETPLKTYYPHLLLKNKLLSYFQTQSSQKIFL